MTITWYGKGPSGADFEIKIESDGDATAIARAAGALDAAMQHASFKASDRFARPAYGGGGGGGGKGRKPDLDPPAGIVVPEHCGEPMKYIIYNKDNVTPKAREGLTARGVPAGKSDMFVCHKDKQCEEVTSGRSDRAYATFDMKPVKPPAAAAPPKPAAPPAAPPAQEQKPPLAERLGRPETPGDRPMTPEEKVSFWTATRGMGYTREQVFEIAADVLTGHGPSMTDVEFTALTDGSKLAVHRVFVALKEKHETTAKVVKA